MDTAGVTTVDTDVAGPFRYRVLDGRYLITNDYGDWLLLEPEEFRCFVEGDLDDEPDLYERLRASRFIHGAIDQADAAEILRRRYAYLQHGPDRHVLVCAGDDGEVMSEATAEKAVDCAFMSTSPALTFVLRGGDPLAHRALLDHVVSYARDKNRLARKGLEIVVESDLGGMDEDLPAHLAGQGVAVHVVLTDALLDDADAPARGWISKLHAAWEEAGADRRVRLIASLTAERLGRVRDIVDLAADLGCSSVDLRRPHNRRFLLGEEGQPGFTVGEWAAAWSQGLDRLLEHARDGRDLYERTARVLAAKVLDGDVPLADDDYRSPARDGIGELAYHHDGRVYASDAGRVVADLADDPLFQVGQLPYQGYHDMITSATVRALVVASTLESQPGWTDCAYKPYVGLCPAENYTEQGSIQGRMQDGSTAAVLQRVLDSLFARLTGGDGDRAILERWAGVGPA
ncbi:MAG: hypothetical protein ACQEXJ_02730 [Myxococcota bacterium]